MAEKTKKGSKQLTVRPEVSIMNPESEVEFASKAATALTKIVVKAKAAIEIKGQSYLKFEGWQTLARFFGYTVGVEKTEQTNDGYLARAIVYDKKGKVIGSAEASCSKAEKNWKGKPDFQVRSMAQTRACSKALRNILAWVAVLAKFAATPAEEMQAQSEMISPSQVKYLYSLCKGKGMKEKDEVLAEVSSILEKKIESIQDLTKAEASEAIIMLKNGEGEEEQIVETN